MEVFCCPHNRQTHAKLPRHSPHLNSDSTNLRLVETWEPFGFRILLTRPGNGERNSTTLPSVCSILASGVLRPTVAPSCILLATTPSAGAFNTYGFSTEISSSRPLLSSNLTSASAALRRTIGSGSCNNFKSASWNSCDCVIKAHQPRDSQSKLCLRIATQRD